MLRVRELRLKAGLTQEQLARASHTNLRTITRVEKEKTASATTLRNLARGLGVPIGDLFEDEGARG